jgi:hypothetical protein
MMHPVRLQLSRRKGVRLQATSKATNGLPAVNCARPGRYGNVWRVGEDHSEFMADAEQATAEQCVSLFRTFAEAFRQADPNGFEEYVAPLRGKNLACWCAIGAPWHADVLLELANTPICEAV